jgi:hypothetical protein
LNSPKKEKTTYIPNPPIFKSIKAQKKGADYFLHNQIGNPQHYFSNYFIKNKIIATGCNVNFFHKFYFSMWKNKLL